jgi:16S rRNA (cytosine967-C5)-methyltransferase
MTNIYPSLLKTAAAGLKRVFTDGQYAEQVLERLLASDSRLGSRDRKFIASVFYDLVRFRRHLEELEERQPLAKPDDWFLKVCLWLVHQGQDLGHIKETTGWDLEKIRLPLSLSGAAGVSVPDWLWEHGMAELPDRWEKELHALNQQAPVYLRVNTLKINPEELVSVLAGEGIEAKLVPGHPDALEMEGRTNVIRLGSFRKGLYEVQDAASQRIAPFVQPEEGQLIIDACAGAGGKTLHLAALSHDKARIVAMDVEGWKLEELKKRASRAGLKSVETELIRGNKTLKYWEGKADRLLLDAPCSGLGVLRRHPDSKWKLNPEAIEEVMETQAEILHRYCRMLKPGGILVYATCSLMPGENDRQVAEFLEEHPEFQLEEMDRTWPSEGWDGFFMARMRKMD